MLKRGLSTLRRRKPAAASGSSSADKGKAVVGIDPNDPDQQAAASKMQALLRGKLARQTASAMTLMSAASDAANKGISDAAHAVSGTIDVVAMGAKRTLHKIEDTTFAAASFVAYPASSLISPDKHKCVVDDVTPEHLWFTPTAGWPPHFLSSKKVEWKEPPKLLTYTANEAPALHADTSGVIGELRVEVLECERLQKKRGLAPDPYALIIFESHAARTNAFRSTSRPKWGTEAPRAFRFPVHTPYACLYVGIKDADTASSDDDVGRVVLELSSLYARTVYDAWLPLQRKNVKAPGKRGAIRLRYSVAFHSDRMRLTRYLHPLTAPSFYIPFRTRVDMSEARFVMFGQQNDHEYNRRVLMSHYRELYGYMEEAYTGLETFLRDLLFWSDARSAGLSIVAGVWWQYLISRPQYLPATFPLGCLLLLADSYLRRNRAVHPIQTKPSFERLLKLLLLPAFLIPHSARPKPLTTMPVPPDPNALKEDVQQWWIAGKVHQRSPTPALLRKTGVSDAGAAPAAPAAGGAPVGSPPPPHLRGASSSSSTTAGAARAAKLVKDLSSGLASSGKLVKEISERSGGQSMLGRALSRRPERGASSVAGEGAPSEGAAASSSSNTNASTPHHHHNLVEDAGHLMEDAGHHLMEAAHKVSSAASADVKHVTAIATNHDNEDSDDEDACESLKALLAELKQDVAEEFAERTEIKATDRKAKYSLATVNPLAKLLGPVQKMLGRMVMPLRSIRRVILWEDRILTTWAVLLLLLATIVLSLIPWAVIAPLLMRLLGMGLFGPHMYFFGKRVEAREAEEAQKEHEYRDADEKGKQAILDSHRNAFLQEEASKCAAIRDKQKQEDRELAEFLKTQKYILAVEPSRTSSRLKYRALPDPHRSRAYPLHQKGLVQQMMSEGLELVAAEAAARAASTAASHDSAVHAVTRAAVNIQRQWKRKDTRRSKRQR